MDSKTRLRRPRRTRIRGPRPRPLTVNQPIQRDVLVGSFMMARRKEKPIMRAMARTMRYRQPEDFVKPCFMERKMAQMRKTT